MNNAEIRLIKAIRSEDVVVWIGAGFSLYAGLPTGKDLAKIFFEMIPEDKRDGISSENLQVVTQAYKALSFNSKKDISTVLGEAINRPPASVKYHSLLASIPHFRTIITTNYDSLIEKAYKNNGQVIYNDKQANNIDRNKVSIFKIHGDLSSPETIIISSDDYTQFFNKQKDENIWTIIGERIATKTQLFIGYSMEDINVNVLFDRIWSNIGIEKKECYYIAPSLPDYKQAYLEKKNIYYINSSGEEFIERLYNTIRHSLLSDFHTGITTPDTFIRFLDQQNLVSTFKKDGVGYQVTKIEGKNGIASGIMRLDFKLGNPLIKDFSDFLSGERLAKLVIPKEVLNSAIFEIEGIPIFSDINGETHLEFERRPTIETTFDIVFPNTGYERNNIPVKVYVSSSRIQLFVDLKVGELEVTGKRGNDTLTDLSFKMNFNSSVDKTSEAIDFFAFAINFYGGEEYSIYTRDGKIFNNKATINAEVVKDAKAYLEYFKHLKSVELFFGKRFRDVSFEDINDENSKSLGEVLSAMSSSEEKYYSSLDITFDILRQEDIYRLNNLRNKKNAFAIQYKDPTIITLLGQSINLGYKRVEFSYLRLHNMKNLIKDKTRTAILKGNKTLRKISYLKELPPEDQTVTEYRIND